MIVTQTPFVRTDTLTPMFFFRSTCKCGKEIYVRAFPPKSYELPENWFHEDNESEFCYRDTVMINKADPVYGPVNLEIYWMG